MKYFKLCWIFVIVLLFFCSEYAHAAPKRKGGFRLPKIHVPKININIHHNNIHIG
ncbi:uncharacterized protein LOC108099614 [Drosophila ficusphila]|uniref:uncharacterized protein LOC108099614 n=1 Tax=Drosophila ficusphila TaxID=30025 RepID=UPI0007E83F67|nr:uncharacterized protein LOC108099614 [Drosophila ficusphila]